MLILLPPSEGKTVPGRRAAPLRLEQLSFPELTPTRTTVLKHLQKLCSHDVEAAAQTLGVPAGRFDEVARNAHLSRAPAAHAATVYSGVLYEALGLLTLTGVAARRAKSQVLVCSALFGWLRPQDRIPAYRLAGNAVIPELGSLPAVWREPLGSALTSALGSGLLVDLRSTTYAALWRPSSALLERTVTVRVLTERTPGDASTRSVVSHFNKATKGKLVASLLSDPIARAPRSAAELLERLQLLGWTAEWGPATSKGPAVIDVLDRQIASRVI